MKKNIIILLLSVFSISNATETMVGRVNSFLNSELILLEGGKFSMGSSLLMPDRNADEEAHDVILSKFYISKHEITQKIWIDLMGYNPSVFNGDNRPVENISWYEAVEFCNKLSAITGLKPCYVINKKQKDNKNENDNDLLKYKVIYNDKADGYRLPTEAEWEYACRGGAVTIFSSGVTITSDDANFNGNYPYNPLGMSLFAKYVNETTSIGKYKPNGFGLYDMHGNVREWCLDWYDDMYYLSGSDEDPHGAESGLFRVVRGGSWQDRGSQLRAALRSHMVASDKNSLTGFRICRSYK